MQNSIISLVLELYQILFVLSIIYILYVTSDLLIKLYGRFKLGQETKFIISKRELVMLWCAITIFITYLIR